MKRLRSLFAPIPAVIVLTLTAIPAGGNSMEPNRNLPFAPGERLAYEILWETVPAGHAAIQVCPMEEKDGVPIHHFAVEIRTNPAIDRLYRVRGRIDGWADLSINRSLKLVNDMKAGGKPKQFEVDFDWDQSRALYRRNEERKNRSIPLEESTLDLVSALYFARSQPLREGMRISRTVNNGKRMYRMTAEVFGRETITVDGSQWEAFRIAPRIVKLNGRSRRRPIDLQVWISADTRRLPLRVVAKLPLGRFIVELRNPDSDHFFFSEARQPPTGVATGLRTLLTSRACSVM
ncbi:MAG: DUF3108 domain-containing protein [Desulfobacterales bacterium]